MRSLLLLAGPAVLLYYVLRGRVRVLRLVAFLI